MCCRSVNEECELFGNSWHLLKRIASNYWWRNWQVWGVQSNHIPSWRSNYWLQNRTSRVSISETELDVESHYYGLKSVFQKLLSNHKMYQVKSTWTSHISTWIFTEIIDQFALTYFHSLILFIFYSSSMFSRLWRAARSMQQAEWMLVSTDHTF